MCVRTFNFICSYLKDNPGLNTVANPCCLCVCSV